MQKKGKLYLLPAPLGENVTHTIPQYVVQKMHELDYFIAERAKTARHYIKTTKPVKAFSELTFFELNKFTEEIDLPSFLEPAEEGHDIGLLSEAGCPGIADPGAVIVAMAHERNIPVVPLVGPSSILLALMASGLNGQNFTFHGYLPAKKNEIGQGLKKLENLSRKDKQAQIFIETPYRNKGMLEEAFRNLSPNTKLCIAVDITLQTEWICTKSIKKWKTGSLPNLHKRPAIFIIGQ